MIANENILEWNEFSGEFKKKKCRMCMCVYVGEIFSRDLGSWDQDPRVVECRTYVGRRLGGDAAWGFGKWAMEESDLKDQ